jgi:polyvinyl alcohol dehydrogenase (cytochrome)
MPSRPLLLAGSVPLIVAFGLAVAHPAAGQVAVPATCGPTTGVAGGEWRTFGHDDANTRHQDRERVISPGDAATLSPAWSFSTLKAGGEGDITGTPIVADGCTYVATNRGWVFSLNADTGALVWKAKVPYGGGVNSTPGVGGGRVYVEVSRTSAATGCPAGDPCIGPYVVALDQATGALAWATAPIDDQPGADVYGSPVIVDGALLIGVSGGSAELGDEADRYAFQGSMNFLDTTNGAVLRKTWTIHPPQQPNDDFAGAGIWSTPAVDSAAKVAYAGTGNPFRPQAEHAHANAVLKFDVDRQSATFGEILGSYKGNIDEYIPAFSQLPCFDIPGNPPPYYPQGIGACGDIDLDFGASPNLFTDASGRKLVGAGQKSGVYHAFDAQTMAPVWNQIVGPPGAVGGIVGSTAYDGQSIFGPITAPGYLWSLAAGDGSHRWFAPVADGAHYGPPVAIANGVAYTVDLTGFLDAYDARSGALLGKRPLALGGTSSPASLAWGGVSVARNTIYAAVGITSLEEGFVVAFRRGTVGDARGDAEKTAADLAGGGGGPGPVPSVGAAIVAGPGAASTTYATPVMTTQVGGPLSFVNADLPQHDVVSDELAPDGQPLFRSRLSGIGEVVPVEGLDRVQSGRQYGFFCSIHPGMRGTLFVR